MKIKNTLSLLLLLTLSLSLVAQRGAGPRDGARGEGGPMHFDVEKHHKERVDFISKELNLTESEKKSFIPLMEEYVHARFELNKEMRDATRLLMDKTKKTSADYQQLIDKDLELKTKEVELQKKYYQKFGEVLSSEKVFKYGFAERNFTKRFVKHYHRQRGE